MRCTELPGVQRRPHRRAYKFKASELVGEIMRTLILAGASSLALAACATVPQQQVAATPAAASEPAMRVPDNILLADWTGGYAGVPPFDRVTPEMFPEAIQFGIDEQRREIAAIIDNPAAPTFANTIEPLERAGARLGRVLSVFGVMTGNMATPAYQALSREWSPKLSAASDAITLDPRLFARIKAVYEARATGGLDAKQQRLATRYYESYTRRGANLSPEQKLQLAAYNSELAGKFSVFSEKVLADESTYITATAAELAGVPDDVKAQPRRRPRAATFPRARSRSSTRGRRWIRSLPMATTARFARSSGARSSTAATTKARTTPTRPSPRSSRSAPTAPGCSALPAMPTGACRTRWPRRRPRHRT
jgi:hypothetical protein